MKKPVILGVVLVVSALSTGYCFADGTTPSKLARVFLLRVADE